MFIYWRFIIRIKNIYTIILLNAILKFVKYLIVRDMFHNRKARNQLRVCITQQLICLSLFDSNRMLEKKFKIFHVFMIYSFA